MEELNKYQEQVRSYNNNLEEIKNTLEEAEEELENFANSEEELSADEALAFELDADPDKMAFYNSLKKDERDYISDYQKKTGIKDLDIGEARRVLKLYNSSEFVMPEKSVTDRFNETRDLTEKERILIDAGLINSPKHIFEGRSLPNRGEISNREKSDNTFKTLKTYKPESKSDYRFIPPTIQPLPVFNKADHDKIPSHWRRTDDTSDFRSINNNNRNRE